MRVVVARRVQADCSAVADLRAVHDGAVIDPAVVGDFSQRPAQRLCRAASFNVHVVIDVGVAADRNLPADRDVASDQRMISNRNVPRQNGAGIKVSIRTDSHLPFENDRGMNEGCRIDADSGISGCRMRRIGGFGTLREDPPGVPMCKNAQRRADRCGKDNPNRNSPLHDFPFRR